MQQQMVSSQATNTANHCCTRRTHNDYRERRRLYVCDVLVIQWVYWINRCTRSAGAALQRLQELVGDEVNVSSASALTCQPLRSLARPRVVGLLVCVETEVVERNLSPLAAALLTAYHALKRTLLLSWTAVRQLHMDDVD